MIRFNVDENDPKVCSAEIEREKLADFGSGRQLPDVRGEAFDRRRRVTLGVEALLDGVTQSLLH